MSAESKEYTLRLSMVGGKPVVTGLNEIGAAGEKNLGKVKASGDLASLALDGLQKKLEYAVKGAFLTAVSLAARAALEDMDRLNDNAERLDITTTRLQEYHALAYDVNVAQAVMEEGLFTFTEQLGAAQAGTGKLGRLLKDYNIELKDGAGNSRRWEDVLRDALDAIKNAGSAQERLNLAQKFFGDEAGRSLLPALAQGSAGFDQIAQKAHEAGRVIKEEHLEAVNRLNDGMKKFASEGWTNFQAAIAGTVFEAQGFFNYMEPKLKHIADLVELVQRVAAGQGPQYAADDIIRGRAREGAQDFIESLKDAAEKARKKLEASKPSGGGGGGNAAQKEAEEIAKVIEALRFRNEQMERSTEEQELYNQLRAAGVTVDSEAGRVIKEQVDRYNELAAAKKEDEEQTKRNKDAAKELGLVFKSAFEDAIVEGKGLSEVLKGLEQDFIRIITRKMITEPLASAAGNFFEDLDLGSIFSSSHHTGGIAGRNTVGRMVPAAAFIGAPRLHGGGGFGLKSNERPAILEEGEGVFTREQMSALGGGARAVKIELNVINEFPEAKVEKRQGAKGEPELVIRRMVEGTMRSAIGSGAMDTVMDGRFGVKPRTG